MCVRCVVLNYSHNQRKKFLQLEFPSIIIYKTIHNVRIHGYAHNIIVGGGLYIHVRTNHLLGLRRLLVCVLK